MPTPSSFDYAVLRVVPRVERQEFVNVGVILYCLTQRFLGASVLLHAEKLRALAPDIALELVEAHLAAVPRLCAGGRGTGPIGQLPQKERFHWLVAPRSTMIQVSPVHSGLCTEPHAALEHLMATMVK